jgi:hypothetical protein
MVGNAQVAKSKITGDREVLIKMRGLTFMVVAGLRNSRIVDDARQSSTNLFFQFFLGSTSLARGC